MGFFSKKNNKVDAVEETPAPTGELKKTEATATAATTSETTSDPMSNNENSNPSATTNEDHKNDADADHNDDDLHEDVEPHPEWDEGGPSHCGYHTTVHDTLMSVGESVHSVVGDPAEPVDSGMKQVGNWFQEASYAVRDFLRGDKEVGDDAADTFNTMHSDVAGFIHSTSMEEKKDIPSELPKSSNGQHDPSATA